MAEVVAAAKAAVTEDGELLDLEMSSKASAPDEKAKLDNGFGYDGPAKTGLHAPRASMRPPRLPLRVTACTAAAAARRCSSAGGAKCAWTRRRRTARTRGPPPRPRAPRAAGWSLAETAAEEACRAAAGAGGGAVATGSSQALALRGWVGCPCRRRRRRGSARGSARTGSLRAANGGRSGRGGAGAERARRGENSHRRRNTLIMMDLQIRKRPSA